VQALFQSGPIIVTWDDHEVDNNWNSEDFDSNRLDAARGAFFEHMALRRDPAHPTRVWRSFRFGRLVEVFMLDLRSERLPSTRDAANAQFVSPAQLAWLVDGVMRSTAVFKLVATPIPIGAYPVLYPGKDQRWQGYAAQRTALLDAIGEVSGLVFVAGDFHFGGITRVAPPGSPHHDLQEVLVGPVAHINPGLSIVELTGDRAQYAFLTASRNFGRFIAELGPTRATLSVELIGPGGEVLATRRLHDLPRLPAASSAVRHDRRFRA
jgi:alkaline phosphatase D